MPVPGTLTDMVTQAEVETAMRRTMTSLEAAASEQLQGQLVSQLELILNRDLSVKTYINEPHIVWEDGQIRFNHGPIVSVNGVIVGTDPTLPPDLTFNQDWVTPIFDKGTRLMVSYTAGDNPPAPAIRGLVINALAKTIIVPAVVAVGAVGAYSVEGTSISYTVYPPAMRAAPRGSAGPGAGRFNVAELGAVMRLKRRTIG